MIVIGVTASSRRREVASGPAPAPTVVAVDAKSGTSQTSHSMLGVPAGALLVLTTSNETHSANCTVSSSPSLTWTKRVDGTGVASANCEIYTAVFAAGGNITVTSNWGANTQDSVCMVITGQEDTLAGATITGAQQASSNVNITSTRQNSLLIGVTADYWAANGSTRTYRSAPVVERHYRRLAGAYTTFTFTKEVETVDTYAMGLTTPVSSDNGFTIAVLEIRPPATVDNINPSPPTISTTDITSTTITIAMSGATDNVGVTGYDVYLDGVLEASDVSSPYTVTGLTPETEYDIHVKSKDAAGNSSINSNTLTETTDVADAHTRDNLVVDHGFEGGDPWPTSVFSLGQDNLGENHGGGTNTWARVQKTDHPNEGAAYHQIEVRSGCDGCQSSGYRSEMRMAAALDSQIAQNNTVEWYGFSIYFDTPQSGGIWTGDSNGHFWQWHPENGSGSATLALYNNWNPGGGWTLAVNPSGGAGADTYVDSNVAITAGIWHHVVMKVFWGTNNDGYVKVWIDGDLIFNETGLDFHTDGQYLKVGMNRWGSTACAECGGSAPSNTWIIGYDNLRIGNSSATFNDVAPVFVFPEPT